MYYCIIDFLGIFLNILNVFRTLVQLLSILSCQKHFVINSHYNCYYYYILLFMSSLRCADA